MEAIEAFNDFLGEQREVEGEATLSMVQFDREVERIFDGVEIDDVIELSRSDYRPRGMTALLDAIGTTISRTRKRLRAEEGNAQVVIVVITDGMENSSRDYSLNEVRRLLDHCEEELGWRFIFLAADLNSVRASRGIGFKQERAFVMGRGGAAHKRGVDLVSKKMAMMREQENVEHLDFTQKERDQYED